MAINNAIFSLNIQGVAWQKLQYQFRFMLDWRQDFAGDLKTGDLYYDLAKLNHNLVFNHDIVNRNLFTIDIRPNEIKCDILRSHNLVKCQQVLRRFVNDYCLNEQKLDILTALIWINMARSITIHSTRSCFISANFIFTRR